jgi:hypothetical protein
MDENAFELRFRRVQASADLVLATSDFTLKHYGDLTLSDDQLGLGAFAARVCAHEPTAEQLQLLVQPEVDPRLALSLVRPASRSELD